MNRDYKHSNSGGEGDLDQAGEARKMFVGERSMSMTAPKMAEKIREEVQAGVVTKPGSTATYMELSLTIARHTMVLPPLADFSQAIRSHIYAKLLDISRLKELQRTEAINGNPMQEKVVLSVENDGSDVVLGVEAPPGASVPGPGGGVNEVFSALMPYNVLGDGNCCLHAVSVAMWGIQDRVGVLRKALHGMMTSKEQFFHKRWKAQEVEWDAEDAQIMGLEGPIEREDTAWKSEWDDVKQRSQRDGAFLTQIHLFVLAHVIRRPIIVFAHTEQDDSLCRFRGVYLPLEWPAGECEQLPLLLGYQGSHFVPLVYHLPGWPPPHDRNWPLVPIEGRDGMMLPVLFSKGRPTRVAGSDLGMDNCSARDLVEARLPIEWCGPTSVAAVRMNFRSASQLHGGRRRRVTEITDMVSENICGMVERYLEDGRREALNGLTPPKAKHSDSDLARVLQEEEWEKNMLAHRLEKSHLTSSKAASPPPPYEEPARSPTGHRPTPSRSPPRSASKGGSPAVAPPPLPPRRTSGLSASGGGGAPLGGGGAGRLSPSGRRVAETFELPRSSAPRAGAGGERSPSTYPSPAAGGGRSPATYAQAPPRY